MIFITGGTGLVGSHILYDLVSAGRQVKALKRPNSDLSITRRIFRHYTDDADALLAKIEWVDGDILDIHSLIDAMQGVEKVIHSAAFVTIDPEERDLLFKINVEGTANCVNAALETGVNRFCQVSSVSAIGRKKFQLDMNEDTKWAESDKNSAYGQSKQMAEREIWRGTVEGLNAIIVNPATIIGPGDWERSSGRLISKVWNGLNIYTTGSNGFVDVRDVSRATIQLMDSDIKNERFIICGENLPFKDLLTWIAEDLGKKAPNIKAGPFLSGIYWRLQWLKGKLTGTSPLVNQDTARTATNISNYSNEKIKKALGYEFIPMRQSVKDACRAFLKDVE